ncbi:MAG: hypothetical protein JSR91_01780 [Proteobacteria bacterium]|nr:hypothetical protein [Pseudomonadota bacterium]
MESSFSLWHWILVLGFIALIIYVAVIIVQPARQPASAPETSGATGGEPVGLGGWLVLFLLYQLLSLLSAMATIVRSLGVHPDGGNTSPDYPELVLAVAWFALIAVTALALLGKHRMFPRLWKTQVVIFAPLAVLNAATYVLAPTGQLLDQVVAASSIIAAIVLAVSWRYVSVSRRVKNTFGASTVVTPTVAWRERFLKGFSIGFLVAALGVAFDIARAGTAFTDGAVQCALLGLLVGGGAGLLRRRRQ